MMTIAAAMRTRTRSSSSIGIVPTIRTTNTIVDHGRADLVRDVTK